MPDVTDGLEVVVACSSHSPDVAVVLRAVLICPEVHSALVLVLVQ